MIACQKLHQFLAYLALIIRTDGIEKPNDLEPDSKAFILLESIETETECFFKLRTGTEEFWNRTSTIRDIQESFNNYRKLFRSLVFRHTATWYLVFKEA